MNRRNIYEFYYLSNRKIELLKHWNKFELRVNRKFTKKLYVNKLLGSKHIASTLSFSRWILIYSVAYFFIQVCATFSCYMNCFMKRPGTNKRIIITAIFFTVFVLKHRQLPLLPQQNLSIIANGDISKYDILHMIYHCRRNQKRYSGNTGS